MKVKIKKPSRSLNNNSNPQWFGDTNRLSEQDVRVNSTLQPVPRNEASLEAELGEVAVLPTKSGIPNTFKIGGDKHYNGGTPLNLPGDSFIYSDTKNMRIKDPIILKQFGMSGKNYTPADIAKKYNINKFKQVLADPNTDDLQRETAEGMITNYNLKLAKLALVQESMKGFPDGIPKVAMPYIESMQINPGDFAVMSPQGGQPENSGDNQFAQQGKEVKDYMYYHENTPGFSGSMKDTKKFGRSYPQLLEAYQQALNSEDPKVMKSTAAQLRNYDIPYSLGWVPGTDQNKLTDLAAILEERSTPRPIPGKTQAEKDKAIGDQASLAYNYYLNKMNTTTDPAEKIKLKGLVDNMAQYNFGYKKKHALPPDAITPLDLLDMHDPYNRNNLYSSEEQQVIQQLYDQVNKEKSKPVEKKKITVTLPSYTKAPANDTALVDDNSFQQGGPITVKNKAGHTKTVYPDGTVVIKDEKGNIISDTRTKSPGKKQSDIAYNVYDPVVKAAVDKSQYNFVPPAEEFRHTKTNVGAQSKFDPESGFYYTDIKPGKKGLEDYIRRNKDIIAQYPGGEDQWKKDHLSGSKTNGFPATKYVIDEINKRSKEISGRDFVDTTQQDAYVPGVNVFNKPGLQKKADEVVNTPTPETKIQGVSPVVASHLTTPNIPSRTPWWLQDIIKTAHAAGNLADIKKYTPWQATPGVFTPEMTFVDPTRELAANAEQSNIGAESLSQFTGPQEFNSRFTQIQGQGAKNAADILSRYNNQNVGISNQQAAGNAAVMNRASENKALADTNLFDKYTIANQNFDNSRAQAKDALMNSFVQGITNANYTANLNDIYPNYAVNPSVGGRDYFRNPRELTGKEDQGPTMESVKNQILQTFPYLKDNGKENDLFEATMEMMGYGKSRPRSQGSPQKYGQNDQMLFDQYGNRIK